jgi:sugar phosphate isomerase/epimerase
MRLGVEAGKETLAVAMEHGVRGVPISAEALVRDGVEATLAPLRAQGLAPCQVGAFGYNPLHPDKDHLARQRALLEQAIPLAAATGCPYLVICGGNYHPSGFGDGDARNFTSSALDEAAAELAPVLALTERHGASLVVEPYLKTAVSTPERFVALQARCGSPALKVTLDVANFYTYDDMWRATESARHAVALLGPHTGIVHIRDLALAPGFHIHIGLCPLGAGPTDWDTILPLIAPYVPGDAWVVLEHVKDAEEARVSLAHLRGVVTRTGLALA